MLLIYPKSDHFCPHAVPIISHLDYCNILWYLCIFTPPPLPSDCSQHSNHRDVPFIAVHAQNIAGSHLIHQETQSPCKSWPPSFWDLASYYSCSLNSSYIVLQTHPSQAHTSHITFLFQGLCICHFLFPEHFLFSKCLLPSRPSGFLT